MYTPPFTVSAEAINMIAEISRLIERYVIRLEQEDGLRLRKINRIRTIHSSLAIEGNGLSEDEVRDIVDGKTYVMAKLTRSHYDALFGAVQAWEDYQGESTLYYNPDTQMIYVDHRYNPFKKSWLGTTQNKPDTETGHKEKYTIEEFMADPMTNILKIIRFSDTIESAITSASTKQKESYATADNTLTGYSYADNNFAIKLNLAPLLGDIKEVSVNIGHDDSMSLSYLNADANIIDVLNLSLRATLVSSTNNSSVADTVKQQVSIFA